MLSVGLLWVPAVTGHCWRWPRVPIPAPGEGTLRTRALTVLVKFLYSVLSDQSNGHFK